MDGVTIIKECTVTSTMGYIMMVVAFIVTMTLSIVSYKVGDVLEYKTSDYNYGRIGAIFSLAFLLCGTFITLRVVPDLDEFQKSNGEYDVTLSSNVDMNVFQSKYDIIDYNNGVYTVKPKDSVPQPSLNTHKETTEETTTEINGQVYKIIPIE